MNNKKDTATLVDKIGWLILLICSIYTVVVSLLKLF
jgi:hypothetical protein